MNAPKWFFAPLVFPLVLTAADPVMGQLASGTDADPELQRLIRQLYAQGDFHGGILIAEGEEVILQQAWGIADHEQGQVLTPEHPGRSGP